MTDTTNGAAPLFEAPASVTVKIDYKGYTGILFTLRGHSGGEVLQKLDAAISWLDEHGAVPTSGHGNGNGVAPAPTPVAANEDGENAVDVDWFTIQPNPDGTRVVAEFWRADRKYPEERVTRKPEQIEMLLDKTGADVDVTRVQKHDVPCRVFYTLGKEKQSGGRYHDVTRVTPLAAG